MSTPSPRTRIAVLAALALVALVIVVPVASAAASVPAEVRVVNAGGKTLAEHTQYTGGVRIKTDPGADCFGSGTGGSGDRVSVDGATALGLVADGGDFDRDLRPLSVSDAFDFGIAVCGIGGFVAPSTGYWYLKRNHEATTTGGDQTPVRRGDQILWYLIRDFSAPEPKELSLRAPVAAELGKPFTVTVSAYNGKGVKRPAAGAKVPGAVGTTDSDGEVRVVAADRGTLELRATRAGDIPSNTGSVCVAANRDACPPARGKDIAGSHRADDIDGSRGADRIDAAAGGDTIDVRGGAGGDRIDCGAGRDEVIAERGQRISARANCERIRRR
jgi:hypothetical protein